MKDDQEERRGRGKGENDDECAHSSSLAKIVFLFFTHVFFFFGPGSVPLPSRSLNFLRKHGDVCDSRCSGTADFHCGVARESLGADKESIVLSWLWHRRGKSAFGPCLRCQWWRV